MTVQACIISRMDPSNGAFIYRISRESIWKNRIFKFPIKPAQSPNYKKPVTFEQFLLAILDVYHKFTRSSLHFSNSGASKNF